MARHEGLYYVVDVVRGRWSPARREARIKQTAQLDRDAYGRVAIWIEQEPGSGGKESAHNTIKNLAGFVARAERVRGSKALRAGPLAAQAEAGNVKLLRGPWNAAFLDELADFPDGAYQDQVDAASGAFNKLALGAPVAKAHLDFYAPPLKPRDPPPVPARSPDEVAQLLREYQYE